MFVRIALLAALALGACEKTAPSSAAQQTASVQHAAGFALTATKAPTKTHVDAAGGARARDVYSFEHTDKVTLEVWVIDLGAEPNPSRTVLTMRDKIAFTSEMIRSEEHVAVGAAQGLDLKYSVTDNGGSYGRSRIVATDKVAYHVHGMVPRDGSEPIADAFVESFTLE